jgi:hypothetical protein
MRKLSFVLLLFGIFIAEVVMAQDTSTVSPETRQLVQNQLNMASGLLFGKFLKKKSIRLKGRASHEEYIYSIDNYYCLSGNFLE